MTEDRPMCHKRHRDWERFDAVQIEAIPRYKTSGLSGDEWRVGYRVRLFYGGVLVHEFWRTKLHYAVSHLPAEMDKVGDGAIPDEILDREKTKCDQQGCARDAETKLELVDLFSSQGEKLDREEKHFSYWRKFCPWHLRRGDGGREDSDRNYRHISGLTEPNPRSDDEAPSLFGGIFEL